MTARKPKKHILSQFMVDDGLQPLDVLMAATRFYLHKGDIASAVRIAETAAMYRHPRYQAVAVQGQLFDAGSGTQVQPAIGPDGRPLITFAWANAPADTIEGAATESKASEGGE